MSAAPLFDDIAEGPAGGSALWCEARDGLRIRIALWRAKAEKGTIFVFPGRTEYIEKYGRLARDLTGAGYAVVAIDWRGQGLADRINSDPALGDVMSFGDYQYDVDAAMGRARVAGLPQPWHLLSHSMGGCIGLRTLLNGSDFASASFSAPMWRILMSPPSRVIASNYARFSFRFGFEDRIAPGQSPVTYLRRADFKGNSLTSDEDTWDFMHRQVLERPELSLGGPTLRWLLGAMEECEELDALPSPDVPCLAFLGTHEEIVDPERITSRMARWPHGELVTFDGARHEIPMERGEFRNRFVERSLAHFDAFARA